MSLTVNIADLAIADRVHRRVNSYFFANHLKAIQEVAAESGYRFVQCPPEEEISRLPADLERAMEERLAKARADYMLKKASAEQKQRWVDETLEDGFAIAILWDILQALDDLGLRLQRHRQEYLPIDQLNFAPSVFDEEKEAQPAAEVAIDAPTTRHRWWWPFSNSAKA